MGFPGAWKRNWHTGPSHAKMRARPARGRRGVRSRHPLILILERPGVGCLGPGGDLEFHAAPLASDVFGPTFAGRVWREASPEEKCRAAARAITAIPASAPSAGRLDGRARPRQPARGRPENGLRPPALWGVWSGHPTESGRAPKPSSRFAALRAPGWLPQQACGHPLDTALFNPTAYNPASIYSLRVRGFSPSPCRRCPRRIRPQMRELARPSS